MSRDNKKKTSNWLRRLYRGGSNTLADDMEKNNVNDVEQIISPSKQILKNFFERKGAVAALCFVIGMFLFVFIAPLLMTNYSDSYTEVTQKDVGPGMNMMSVPKELKNNIKQIDTYGVFSVGVSNDGKVYTWGKTKIGTTGLDVSNIPEEVKNDKIAMVQAGIDHIIAISESGKVYGWGNKRLGQYGEPAEGEENSTSIIYMPKELIEGTIDVSQIKRFECGYQCTAILMNDGKLYIWGNRNAYNNIDKFVDNDSLIDIAFTLNYIVGVQEAANTVYTGTKGLYGTVRTSTNGKSTAIKDYLKKKKKITNIYATNDNVCLMLNDNTIVFAGEFKSDAVKNPKLAEGEYFTHIAAGTNSYTGVTNKGKVYSWGDNTLGQSNYPSKLTGVDTVYAGAFQSYAVNSNGKLLDKWGLKGYLFGTDKYGADIFQRIANGGRMTMTIGAVAVLISSFIGIIVGCLAGYFGGKVDMVLMRVIEGFSAIPFMPLAMILSSVMAQMTMSENMRIFIIMVILGLISWTGLARLVRGQVLSVREGEYVIAAQAMGVKSWKIAFKHILPNVISVIIVSLTLDFAGCMLTESGLSFLGFGVNYPKPTWGNMLNGAKNAIIIKNYWWQWVFASLFLASTTICINIVGDALRDVMDPKSSVDK